jgi:hypothetical protein
MQSLTFITTLVRNYLFVVCYLLFVCCFVSVLSLLFVCDHFMAKPMRIVSSGTWFFVVCSIWLLGSVREKSRAARHAALTAGESCRDEADDGTPPRLAA